MSGDWTTKKQVSYCLTVEGYNVGVFVFAGDFMELESQGPRVMICTSYNSGEGEVQYVKDSLNITTG